MPHDSESQFDIVYATDDVIEEQFVEDPDLELLAGYDHGLLFGLADDDHTQYLKEKAFGGTAAEIPLHTHAGASEAGTIDHGALTGLGDDDHTQYVLRSILTTNGDIFVRLAGVVDRLAVGAAGTFLGVTAGLPAWIAQSAIDHGSFGGLSDDDHPQYLHLSKGAEQDVVNGVTFASYVRIGSAVTPTNATAGDLTAVRLIVGDDTALAAGTGLHGRMAGTLTGLSGGQIAMLFSFTAGPTTNSTAEYRSTVFQALIAPSAGVTITGANSAVKGMRMEPRMRSDATVDLVIGGEFYGVIYDGSTPASPGTVATSIAGNFNIMSRLAGTSTGTITTVMGIRIQGVGNTTAFTSTLAQMLYVTNPSTFASLGTLVGIDIDAMTRGTTNFGIRNAGNSVQTGYARFGAVTAPTNTTAGDLTVVRLKVVDGAFGTGVDFSVTGDGALSGFLRVGSETAPANTTAGDFTAIRAFLTGVLDLSGISAGTPNMVITATSDTPTVAFTGGGSAPTTAPAGYIEITVGGNSRYIPFWA